MGPALSILPQAFDELQKPFTMSELASGIQEVVDAE